MREHDNVADAEGLPQPIRADQTARAAEVLRHLADPTRLHLLRLLARGAADVNGLTAQVAASRSSVSQHLSRLRLAGLVRAERHGRHMYYRLTSDHLHRLIDEVSNFADHIVRDIPHHENWATEVDVASTSHRGGVA